MASPPTVRVLSRVLIAGLLASSVGACIQKPSEEECEDFTKHMVTLLAQSGEAEHRVRQLGNKHKDAMIEACVRGGTRQEVECTLAADSLDEVAQQCKR